MSILGVNPNNAALCSQKKNMLKAECNSGKKISTQNSPIHQINNFLFLPDEQEGLLILMQ